MEFGNLSYKEYHEKYIINLDGTSKLDVCLVLISVFLVGFIQVYCKCLVKLSVTASFAFDLVTLVVPSVFFVSICNDHIHLISLALTLTVLAIIKHEVSRKHEFNFEEAFISQVCEPRRPYISLYKAMISLITGICILAVDFTVFPLKHAKTENYGYSLMDTGVGFFIFSNGLTIYLSNYRLTVKKTISGIVPVLILGLIRYASVDMMDYQKHVTEYGVHWNFFFTLAFVKLFGSMTIACLGTKTQMLAIVLCFGHQFLLCFGLENWVLSTAPRTNWLSANREGIVSLMGYLSIYLAAAHLGRKLDNRREGVMTIQMEFVRCFIIVITSVIGLFATSILSYWFPPSRRLVNSTFILWMFSLSILILGLIMLLESFVRLVCRLRYHNKDTQIEHSKLTQHVLQAVAYNNLLFFLVCNLMTGAINVTIQTLYVPPIFSVFILILYTTTCCGICHVLYENTWRLKFW